MKSSITIAVLVGFITGMILSPKADAHTVKPAVCDVVWANAPDGKKYEAKQRCLRWVAQHAWNHRCGTIPKLIHCVFGRHGDKAVQVATCESTLTPSKKNGQYWGLFQVSKNWRDTIPGFGWTAESQVRHAWKVFNHPDVGQQWSPTWSCA